MGLYETTFIVNPQTDDATIDRHVKAVVDIVTGEGGKVVYENRMGTRRLAYEINGLSQGYYANFIFEGPKSAVPKLDRHMRLEEAYMRHLTVVFEGPIPDKDAPPSMHDTLRGRPPRGRSDRPYGRREGGRDRERSERAKPEEKKEAPATTEETKKAAPTAAEASPPAAAEPSPPPAETPPAAPPEQTPAAVTPPAPEPAAPATVSETPAPPEPVAETETPEPAKKTPPVSETKPDAEPAKEDTYSEEDEL